MVSICLVEKCCLMEKAFQTAPPHNTITTRFVASSPSARLRGLWTTERLSPRPLTASLAVAMLRSSLPTGQR